MSTVKVLFIGNSYTYYNRLPSIISQLAASSGQPYRLETDMQAYGSKTLEWHYHNPLTLEAIRKAGWDIVVLQEFSTRPIEHRDKMFEYAARLDREIKHVKAETFLYLTWSRRHIPEMQEGLTDAYRTLARKLNATVAPVGVGWQKALKSDPTLALHKNDNSHPTALGSYLAACIFFSTFFRTSPVGLTGTVFLTGENVLTVNDTEAHMLQSIAWETVQKFKP